MKKLTLLFMVVFLCAWTLDSFAQKVNVTFKVDMKVYAKKKLFIPGTDVVTVAGGFNNWLNTPPANTEKILDGPGADSIYTKTLQVDANATYEFKYAIGTDWGKDELSGQSNRSVVVGLTDMVLPVVWYNNEAMPTGADAEVTFKADMRLPMKQQTLVKGTGKVYAAGDFNGWNTTATELVAGAAPQDSIYSATVTIKSAQLINYKFLYTDKNGGTPWEDDPNKTSWIVDGPQNIARPWNNVDPTVTLRDGAVNFECDLTVLQTTNLFDPAKDQLQIRGSFNGWNANDPTKSSMNQDPLNPAGYFLSVGFTLWEVNSALPHKYRVEAFDQTGPLGGDAGYERPFSTGGGNRSIQFKGVANQNFDSRPFFNDIYPSFIIPAGVTVTAKFRVDMTPATDPVKQAIPFDAATDSVFLVPGQAAWAAKMGWKEGQDRALQLTREGSTLFYSGSVNVVGPAFNGFTYIYEYGKPAPNGMQKEPTGFANFVYRVRFIPQPSGRNFTQPYTVETDVWTNAEAKTGQIETLPRGLTSAVEPIQNSLPTTFNLEQNYPNPFNPTTVIRFSLPSDELVSLKIYNVLGQEVQTLLNKQMRAGSYNVDFNATKLSSGVYFYRIEAGNYNVTKKMLLIK